MTVAVPQFKILQPRQKVWEQARYQGLCLTHSEEGPRLLVALGDGYETTANTELDIGEVQRLRDSLTQWLRLARRQEG